MNNWIYAKKNDFLSKAVKLVFRYFGGLVNKVLAKSNEYF